MKKFIILFIFFQVFSSAKNFICAVPIQMKKEISTLFSPSLHYGGNMIKTKIYPNNKSALQALAYGKANFAIVRADILWHIQLGSLNWHNLKGQYLNIASLPYIANLYLIQSFEKYDIDLIDLKNKKVSINTLGDANNVLLKSLLALFDIQYNIHYKSIPYNESLSEIEKHNIDAFFGFLPQRSENTNFHFQNIFSSKSMSFMQSTPCYQVDYDGIHTHYMLIANKEASDKEIESIIYILEKKGIFDASTDESYGPVNRYVIQHLTQVRRLIKEEEDKKNQMQQKSYQADNPLCLKYHYGFLDLLRRKPALKKKLQTIKQKYSNRYLEAKKSLQKIEKILISIDKEKDFCNMKSLEQKSLLFKKTSQKLYRLAH